jgi:enoyl-CoA hydratase
MEDQEVLTTVKSGTLYVTINRAAKMNALNKAVLHEIAEAIAFAYQSEEVRAVLITGAGEKAFVAGADISEFQNYNLAEGKALAKNGHQTVFDAIANCPKPIVAAINGFALGGGLELAMACHIRIASENAKLGLPEVTLGLIPGYGGTQRLTQLIGKGRAIEMIATADMITAEKALQIGLVNQVVPQNELIATADLLLDKIKSRAPLAVASAIRAVNAASSTEVNGFDVEIEEFANCFQTEDFKEGVNAFFEKRKANFQGK